MGIIIPQRIRAAVFADGLARLAGCKPCADWLAIEFQLHDLSSASPLDSILCLCCFDCRLQACNTCIEIVVYRSWSLFPMVLPGEDRIHGQDAEKVKRRPLPNLTKVTPLN